MFADGNFPKSDSVYTLRNRENNNPAKISRYTVYQSVGHDQWKLSRTCEKVPLCDDKITENDRS